MVNNTRPDYIDDDILCVCREIVSGRAMSSIICLFILCVDYHHHHRLFPVSVVLTSHCACVVIAPFVCVCVCEC